ncbi:Membrane-bound transcription factor site-2 protease-like [Mycena kentingensis (nom. inval.)]|nr:Membrane-bound transcription factor site-2 protease-like [Mycena kentingensis (nom. inval.)]
MDIDPLAADSAAPRHAIESDDEEDEYNPLNEPTQPIPSVDVQLVGLQPTTTLLVATGDAAKVWARGANLGEQVGAAYVNKIQVGLVFNPSWTKCSILVSEATTRLPLWAMRPYARAILELVNPQTLVLLDEYAVHSYISDTRIRVADAPLRFLTTAAPPGFLTHTAEPFSPPNLIQSASAAFVAQQAEQFKSAALLLVPAPSIPAPAPRTLASTSLARLENTAPFDPEHLRVAHNLLAKLVGDASSAPWTTPPPEKPSATRARPETDAELSMYI